jgi:predicted RNase H-like HicB family nuclease
MQYAVIFEKSANGYGAYAPDLPGTGAVGRTLAVTRKRIKVVIEAHIEGLRADGLPVPAPSRAHWRLSRGTRPR